MKKIAVFILLLISFFSHSQQYPEAKKIPVTFSKHKFTYDDNYSWMEKTNSDATTSWVEAENSLTYSHLETVKKKYSTASKIKEYDLNL